MKNTWFISDTHFGHENMLNFVDKKGDKVRKFDCVEEMDEFMVSQWNSVVGKYDRVYHLGDVVINKKHLKTLDRLNGKKVLIKGNHDIYKLTDYTPYFEDIRAYRVFPKHKFICSHIPVHESQLERFKVNVHGHLHSNIVEDSMYQQGGTVVYPDIRYLNICVEKINYTPIHLDDIVKYVENHFPDLENLNEHDKIS